MSGKEALKNLVKASCPRRVYCYDCEIKDRCNSFAKGWIEDILRDLNELDEYKANKMKSYEDILDNFNNMMCSFASNNKKTNGDK